MHPGLLTILIALMLTGGAYPARAQEAGKIVEQYVKAAGGGRALAKIQTLTLEGALRVMTGRRGLTPWIPSCQIATTRNC